MKEQQLSSGAYQAKEILVRPILMIPIVSIEAQLSLKATDRPIRWHIARGTEAGSGQLSASKVLKNGSGYKLGQSCR